jgi:hypothetical protein
MKTKTLWTKPGLCALPFGEVTATGDVPAPDLNGTGDFS